MECALRGHTSNDHVSIDLSIFSSSKGEKNYNWTGKKYSDLFVVGRDVLLGGSESVGSKLEAAHGTSTMLMAELNSDFNDASATFTVSGDKVFFVHSGGEKDVDIQYTKIYYNIHIITKISLNPDKAQTELWGKLK